MRVARFAWGCGLLTCLSGPAAADLADWSVSPLSVRLQNLEFRLGGDANGAVFTNDQARFPGLDTTGATGALRFFPSLERDYDSGLIVALKGSILAFHDRFSNDRYGGDVFEKGYLSVQTGLGTIELGDTDGAAYRLAITGPKVDEKTSIENPEITFFRDPLTGRAFDEIFTVRTEVGSSVNFAKLSYYSPRLFGVQLAFSYAPSEGKDVIPFVANGPHVANRERNLWEVAANYNGNFGALSLGTYAALAMAHDDARTAGHEGLTDWALGTALDYNLNDDWKLSLGGSYRQTNAYAFNLNNVLSAGSTRALHASTSATYRSWIAGFEFTDGTADGSLGAPTLGVHGYEATLGYVLNSNLQLATGWQQLRYARSTGLFYTGPKFAADAYFLHLDFHV
jgi:hypothetical protein